MCRNKFEMPAYKLKTFCDSVAKKWRNNVDFDGAPGLWFQLLGVRVPSATLFKLTQKRQFQSKNANFAKFPQVLALSVFANFYLFLPFFRVQISHSPHISFKFHTVFSQFFRPVLSQAQSTDCAFFI